MLPKMKTSLEKSKNEKKTLELAEKRKELGNRNIEQAKLAKFQNHPP